MIPAPRSFRRLLDESVRWCRTRGARFYVWVALPSLLLQLPVALLQVWQWRVMGDLGSLETDPTSWILPLALGCGFLLLVVPVYSLLVLAVAVAVQDEASGRPAILGDCLRFALQPRVWGTSLLVAVLVGMGFFLLVLPGVYLALRLCFVIPVLRREGVFGMASLQRSWELSASNPGRWHKGTVAKVLTLALVSYLLNVGLTLPLQIPIQAAVLVGMVREGLAGQATAYAALADGPTAGLMVLATLLGSLAQSAVLLWGLAVGAQLYGDTRARREGADLLSAPGAPTPSPVPAR